MVHVKTVFMVIGILATVVFLGYIAYLKWEGKSDSLDHYPYQKSFKITSEKDYYMVYTLVAEKEFIGAIFFSSPSCTQDFLRKQTAQKCPDGKYRTVLASHCDQGHALEFFLGSSEKFQVESALQGQVAERKWWDILLTPLGL